MIETHVPTLRTARLILRAPAELDIDPIYQACQDPSIQRYTLVPVPYRRSDAEWFVRVNAADPASATWLIEAADGHLAGTIGVSLHTDPDHPDTGSLGYWCAPADRGNGYVREALRAVLECALTPVADGGLGLERVTWRALCDNVASARAAASVGFRSTGRRTDDIRSGAEEMHTAEIHAEDDRRPQRWSGDVIGS